MPFPTRRPAQSGQTLLEDNLSFLNQATAGIARRHGFFDAEADDFRSFVFEKLVADDYRVLREFAGRSSLKTYLNTVILRLAIDFHRRRSGRWQPSAAATRLGPAAVKLEELVYRDGRTVEEAVQVLKTDFRRPESESVLRELALLVSHRPPTRMVDEAALEQFPDPRPDPRLVHGELAEGLDRALRRVIVESMLHLRGEDRLMLKMRFHSGFSAGEIGDRLNLSAKQVYRRIEANLGRLKKALAAAGITRNDIEALLGDPSRSLPFTFSLARPEAATETNHEPP